MSDALKKFEAGLDEIAAGYQEAFASTSSEQTLREVNARFVGPQGSLTRLMKTMRDVPGEHRRELGQKSNALKQQIATLFDSQLEAIHAAARKAELEGPALDVSLPGRAHKPGRLHPITRVKHELFDIFTSMGFEISTGPEIDTHANCFDRLGFPPDHPATDMQDTFFVKLAEDRERTTLLRTHTSTVQIREMSRRPPPLAVVSAGPVYRRDDDATHSPMFHQLEGFLVDTQVSFADLKGVLTVFLERLLGSDVEVRFRPSYFPFVEPGAEVDVRRPGGPWMEILGCGMIHPVVFESVGYDPDAVTGFAFGLGIDRIAMVKYGIPNIKLLFENDVRFLSSF